MQLDPDDEAFIGNEDRLIREQMVKSNDAFVAMMMKQIRRGKEKVSMGVKVDLTACTTKRMRGEPIFSGVGSSAAMCAEKGDTDTKEIASYV